MWLIINLLILIIFIVIFNRAPILGRDGEKLYRKLNIILSRKDLSIDDVERVKSIARQGFGIKAMVLYLLFKRQIIKQKDLNWLNDFK